MNVSVVGSGYVGLANSFLIGLSEKVELIDIDEKKIELLKKKTPPINDEYITKYIDKVDIEYKTSSDYKNSDYIFVAVNTDYDEVEKKFNLKAVEAVIKDIDQKSESSKVIIIKSTIPVGYTKELNKRYPNHNILFSPEFLREGKALYDNLYPDRIIVGGDSEYIDIVMDLLSKNILSKNVPLLKMTSTEAEVVKLFANTYLASRVAFVNELDTYCMVNKLNTMNIINAIGYDKRIGRYYFNPSFGYGGYCLPKDTKELKHEYEKQNISAPLIDSIVKSNENRKEFIVSMIEKKINKNDIIGFYRLISKKGINNIRSSASVDILDMLLEKGYKVIVFEPTIVDDENINYNIVNNILEFKTQSNLIIANRLDENINGENVFSTDVYNDN